MKIKPEDRFWIGIYAFTGFIMLIAMSVFGWLAWTSRQEPARDAWLGARPRATTTSIPDERFELLASFNPLNMCPKARRRRVPGCDAQLYE